MSTQTKFYNAIDGLLETIQTSQDTVIEEAAVTITQALEKGHGVHIYDTGHIIDMELVNRVGGFTFLRRFKYQLNVDSLARDLKDKQEKRIPELASLALKASNVRAHDVMIIGSVSGISQGVLDVALACKEMGVSVICITSVAFSKTLESLHESHQKLYEVADIVIDNCAPVGDGMLDVGLPQPFMPASGISAAYIMWSMCAQIFDKLQEKGITPGILGSINKPGNDVYNDNLEDLYRQKGY